mgnify:CR=1 FL=1
MVQQENFLKKQAMKHHGKKFKLFLMKPFLAKMTPSFLKITNRQAQKRVYTLFTISKTYGEQKWLLLAKNLEQASIFVFNADTALI